MEIKAYLEGILRGWWLIGLFLVLSLFIGNNYGKTLTTQYTALSLIQINSALLTKYTDPTNVVQLAIPQSYLSQVAPPAQLDNIQKHYPRIPHAELTKNIVVIEDSNKQTIQIHVTDIYPQSAIDIANYLAQQFVHSQSAELQRQTNYYASWLPQNIATLQAEVGKLGLQIQQLTPVQQRGVVTPPISTANQRIIAADQNQLGVDQRKLYYYQRAYMDLQNTHPLFSNAFVILQEASTSNVSAVPPALSPTLVNLIAVAFGLAIAIIALITSDYFIPVVRHEGEVQRITNLPVLAKVPSLRRFEQKRLTQPRAFLFHQRVNDVRVACAMIGAPAIMTQGYTILLTSPRRKRNFASTLASILASNGYSSLLIDLDFNHPTLQDHVRLVGPSNLHTEKGTLLSFISKTANPQLFALPAKAMLDQNTPLNSQNLMELLPDLQKLFNVIIIDAPPLNHADTHFFAKLAKQVLLVVKKRRDGLVPLKMVYALDQELKLNIKSLLLT